jgi:predicted nucleic acid-binding protein
MSDSLFFDTNVLVYAFDRSDQKKYEIASELVTRAFEEGNGIVSTQVLQEFFVTVTRKIPEKMAVDDAEQTIRDLAVWRVIETSVPLILEAIEFHRRFDFSFWDAMILAACHFAGSPTLVSEDLSHGTMVEGIQVVNPFHKNPP